MHRLSALVVLCPALLTLGGCDTAPVSPPPVFGIALDPLRSGDGQAGKVAQQLPQGLRVLVTRNGLPTEGVEVSWAVSPGDGAIGAVSTSGADGIATGLWTMPTTSGARTATATLAGAIGSPLTFHATAVAGPATSFDIQAGNNQSVPAGTPASEPLAVRLQDQYGNPVPGSSVTWALLSGSATLSAASTDTDAGGSATVSVTAGPTPGPVAIRAIPDVALPSVDFALTVVP